ncbi:hypothetical protein LAZ67_6002690 [Cordylochernes scorpioides]|uniref:Uncharacterized protein n=1 Tax=Cordylochernes scorpioides TaxID=51811 RepID=A0ABY6KKF1_9ARAC|nr:hypothetical protein LAZ67_6002690 [Cordylochernes scorpioides]
MTGGRHGLEVRGPARDRRASILNDADPSGGCLALAAISGSGDRVFIEFLETEECSDSEIHQRLKNVYKEATIYDDKPRNGRPSTNSEDKAEDLIRHNRRITIIELVQLCQELLDLYESQKNTLFSNFVTGDETWAYLYDPELEWHHPSSPKKKKFKVQRSSKKPQPNLRRCHVKNQRSLLNLSSNIMTMHTSFQTSEAIGQMGWSLVPQPPYNPDLAPCDFYLFSPLKKKV